LAGTVATGGTGAAALLIVGWLANFTVMGSVAPWGTVPERSLIAASASDFRLNRMKPTPFVRPEIRQDRARMNVKNRSRSMPL